MANFRTITARFPGTCRRCQGPIAVGQRIRFGGKGMTYHLKADCGPTSEGVADAAVSNEPVFRTCAQGGRCEDYPCCGCHGLHELYMPSEPPDPYDRY